MNTQAELAALKRRVKELEAAVAPQSASSPATVGERYGNAHDLARNAAELPPALERDVFGMIRIKSGSLATPEQIESAFALKPQVKREPQPIAPIEAEELSPTELRTKEKIAANEAKDKAFHEWSSAGLPSGWFRDLGGLVRKPDGTVAPVALNGGGNE